MGNAASAVVRCPESFGTDWLLNLYKCLAQTCSKGVHDSGKTGIMLIEYDLDAADFEIKSELVLFVPLHLTNFLRKSVTGSLVA